MFPYGPGSEQNWCTTGVKKWDKMKSRGVGNPGKLSEHFSSKAHKASLSDYVQFVSNNSRIDTLLDKETRAKAIQIEEETENNRSVIKIINYLCRTLARQGIYPLGAPNRTPVVTLRNFFPCCPDIALS